MWSPDYEEISSTFNGHEVTYFVVGAYAMAGHGFLRATGDIALWVEPTPDSAARVHDALVKFGAPASRFNKEDSPLGEPSIRSGGATADRHHHRHRRRRL